jgi:hypothetical protein
MTAPRIADSLAGRMETVSLLPLAQSELQGTPPTFFNQAFAGAMPCTEHAIMDDDLIVTVLAGGYPEALTRASGRRCDGNAFRLQRPTQARRGTTLRGVELTRVHRNCMSWQESGRPVASHG